MEKILKDTQVFNLHSDKPIVWEQIKNFKLDNGDVLEIGYENSTDSYDGYYYAYVTRKVLETDKEFEHRKEMDLKQKGWLKERRRETYLKLKKEFENDGTIET